MRRFFAYFIAAMTLLGGRRTRLFLCCVALGASLLCACARPQRAPSPAPQPPQTAQAKQAQAAQTRQAPREPFTRDAPFGPRLTFAEFLEQALRPHVLSTSSLYVPPQPGFETGHYLVLSRESGPAPILGEVASLAWGERGLAAGLNDGQIRVFSDWPCPGLALPDSRPVERLSWQPESPFLAAVGQDDVVTRVFDLRKCGEVATFNAGGKIRVLTVSPSGRWLALVDEARRLRLGPPSGPLEMAAALRFEPLDIAFTPQEGALLAADAGGWATVLSPTDKATLDAVQIPGGPFSQARYSGKTLTLGDEEGRTVVWNVANRSLEPEGAERRDSLYLTDGVVYVRGGSPRWVKKVVLRPPEPRVQWSASRGLIRVQDLDGRTLDYDAKGEPLSESPESAGKGGQDDWTEVSLDDEAGFEIGSARYKLADPVFRQGGDLLLCRAAPGKGFFLWWRKASGRPIDHRGASLPVRRSLRADAPVEWVSLAASAKAY